MKELFQLKEFGYFNGLEKAGIYNALSYNYKSASNAVKEKMDSEPGQYLSRYKNGVSQLNFLYKRIDSIYRMMTFFTVLVILGIIGQIIFYINILG